MNGFRRAVKPPRIVKMSWLRLVKPLGAALLAAFSYLAAYLKGRQAGRASELKAEAKRARKRGDAEELRDVIKRSH